MDSIWILPPEYSLVVFVAIFFSPTTLKWFSRSLRTGSNNYRPISVLPVVSKLIESNVFNQLYKY